MDRKMEVDKDDVENVDEDSCSGEPRMDKANQQLFDEILSARADHPQMFVSAWEEDEQGIQPKDMSNPIEQFLTAAEEGDLETMQRLYDKDNALLMAQDADKYSALHRAAYSDKTNVCAWLLSKGANAEMRTGEGWTPLHCAANWGNHEVVKLLLAHGVDVNARTEGNIVPLHLAINSAADDPERRNITVRYLLETPGVEMNAVNMAGDTPSTLARRISADINELVQRYVN